MRYGRNAPTPTTVSTSNTVPNKDSASTPHVQADPRD
jgi:hypothetical protein